MRNLVIGFVIGILVVLAYQSLSNSRMHRAHVNEVAATQLAPTPASSPILAPTQQPQKDPDRFSKYQDELNKLLILEQNLDEVKTQMQKTSNIDMLASELRQARANVKEIDSQIQAVRQEIANASQIQKNNQEQQNNYHQQNHLEYEQRKVQISGQISKDEQSLHVLLKNRFEQFTPLEEIQALREKILNEKAELNAVRAQKLAYDQSNLQKNVGSSSRNKYDLDSLRSYSESLKDRREAELSAMARLTESLSASQKSKQAELKMITTIEAEYVKQRNVVKELRLQGAR